MNDIKLLKGLFQKEKNPIIKKIFENKIIELESSVFRDYTNEINKLFGNLKYKKGDK